ncbi:MAG TPA: alpha-L-rhamnosidase C-terminal domain-containing protein, partial [Candidatus Methylacidiphilales bacterium]
PDRGLPLQVEPTGPGGFRSYLLDFGQTVVGHFVCEMRGAAGGEIVDTHYAESIDAATLTPDYDPAAHSKPAIGDRLVCRAGDASHLFYHPCGFRYAMVTVRDALAPFEIGLRFRRVGYPLERKGSFSSSDPALEKIWEACVRTQECCSLDAYVDTPWREQAQWWGDARVQAWNTFHIDGDIRLFRRGIRQIALQTTFDGLTYGHAPTMGHECVLPDFTLIWLLTLWDDYWQTGETDLFAAHHGAIQTALGYFRGKADPKSGLVPYDDRYWLFLDWTDLFRDGVPAVYNLWLLIALEKTASLYRKVRRPREAVPLEAWAGRLRRSLEGLVDRRGLVRDGIDRKGRPVPDTSLHSQTLAIAAGLRGVDIPRAVGTLFLPFLRGEIRPKSDPSAYWITYIFSLMGALGHGAEVVSCIRRRWLPMAEHGTTWENWEPKPGHESRSHAWSAHPLFHLMQTVGGIAQTAPAWREIDFRPVFHGESGGASVPTPRGTIVSGWKRAGAGVEVSLRMPHGVKAKIDLPGMRPRTIAGGGRWTVACGKE